VLAKRSVARRDPRAVDEEEGLEREAARARLERALVGEERLVLAVRRAHHRPVERLAPPAPRIRAGALACGLHEPGVPRVGRLGRGGERARE
jgi:hypothetical protein